MVMKNPETLFTKEEQERIEQTVIAAEGKTSGEIVPMIVSASGRYAEAELAGVVFGLIMGTMMELIWHDPWGQVHAYIGWPMVGAILGYAAARIPALKRRILPQRRIAGSPKPCICVASRRLPAKAYTTPETRRGFCSSPPC
jgi:putative membrane protein